jgi:hypothetical protein
MSFTNNEDDSYNNMDVFLVDGNITLMIRKSFFLLPRVIQIRIGGVVLSFTLHAPLKTKFAV